MKKTILLSLGILVLGVLALDRARSGKRGAGFPGDFRDAPGPDSALGQIGSSGDSGAVVPEPAFTRVSGIPVIRLQLNFQAFRGDTGEATKRNVADFVGRLGKKMVAYDDTSVIGTVKIASEGRRGMFAAMANQLRIESALRDLPEIERFRYESSSAGQVWDVKFEKTMYRDRIDKMLAPLAAKHGIIVGYPNSIATLDLGILEAEILADSADPAEYAGQLCKRFPDKLKYVDRVCCAVPGKGVGPE